jgi:hypothetical protein
MLPGYVNFLTGEGKYGALSMSQLGFSKEKANYQWQVHSLTKRYYVTMTEIPVVL